MIWIKSSYEEIGRLPAPTRCASGYRCYTHRDAERLAFIRRAKALDLSLHEIGAILALRQQDERPCGQVLSVLDEKRYESDARIQQVQTFRAEVMRLRADWTDVLIVAMHPRADWTDLEQHAPTCGSNADQICPILQQQIEVRAS